MFVLYIMSKRAQSICVYFCMYVWEWFFFLISKIMRGNTKKGKHFHRLEKMWERILQGIREAYSSGCLYLPCTFLCANDMVYVRVNFEKSKEWCTAPRWAWFENDNSYSPALPKSIHRRHHTVISRVYVLSEKKPRTAEYTTHPARGVVYIRPSTHHCSLCLGDRRDSGLPQFY